MQDTELVVRATLCLASGGSHISTKNSNPASAGMLVLVCGQSTVILTLFEGGLLCVRK
jgi:hypothetical protein